MPVIHDPHTGKFAPGPHAAVTLTPSEERAWSGEQERVRAKLSKLETGELGEQIAMEYLRQQEGMTDVHSINVGRNNAPVDAVGDHTAYEIKAGLASNTKAAQQWRATAGEPGPEEKARLKAMSADEKKAWNERKQDRIIERKQRALQDLSKQVGTRIKGRTLAMIIHADKRRADLFVFDGFHPRIGWRSAEAKQHYVGTWQYA